MKIMVAYDGTLQAKEALVYGIEKAREKGGEVLALQVFDNGLFVDYDVMDAEAAARREYARFADEAKALIREKASGVRTSFFTTEGDPEAAVIEFAKARHADVLLCPPAFSGIIGKYQKATAELGEIGSNLAAVSTKAM